MEHFQPTYNTVMCEKHSSSAIAPETPTVFHLKPMSSFTHYLKLNKSIPYVVNKYIVNTNSETSYGFNSLSREVVA